MPSPTPSYSKPYAPVDYDVIAAMNLNGDYISDALAACVGGIGIASAATSITKPVMPYSKPPTAPLQYADQDKVNPGSVILSGEMMFPVHWMDRGGGSHHSRHGTDPSPPKPSPRPGALMEGGTLLKTSEFGRAHRREYGLNRRRALAQAGPRTRARLCCLPSAHPLPPVPPMSHKRC